MNVLPDAYVSYMRSASEGERMLGHTEEGEDLTILFEDGLVMKVTLIEASKLTDELVSAGLYREDTTYDSDSCG